MGTESNPSIVLNFEDFLSLLNILALKVITLELLS